MMDMLEVSVIMFVTSLVINTAQAAPEWEMEPHVTVYCFKYGKATLFWKYSAPGLTEHAIQWKQNNPEEVILTMLGGTYTTTSGYEGKVQPDVDDEVNAGLQVLDCSPPFTNRTFSVTVLFTDGTVLNSRNEVTVIPHDFEFGSGIKSPSSGV